MPEQPGEKPVEMTRAEIQQAAKVETASPSRRRYRAVVFQAALFSALGLFILLAVLVETTTSFPLDIQITRAIQSIDFPLFSDFMRLISWPGFYPQSIIIILLIALVLHLYGLHWESVTSLLAALISGVINEWVKNLIQRPRPAADLVDIFEVLKSYSFPSAHVMFYTIVFGFIWYLAYTLLKRSMQRSLLLGLFGVLILLVGVSRIYLGQHWASDVLGAYLLGGLSLVGIVLLYQWGKKRFFVHQPVAPSDFRKE
ncbi:MAG: phosphatase PAP2 family protein [Chloroflexota bacterium]